MMKLFSIVIPCFNCEKYLKECLESITNQTYKDYEIIIVNDGSKDNSLAIMQAFKKEHSDTKITIIDQQNSGGIISRKVGIDASSGKYILLADADDWLEKDTLATIASSITQYGEPDIVKYRYYNEPSGITSERYIKENDEMEVFLEKGGLKKIWKLLLYSDSFNTIWSCAFKKELFDFNNPIYQHIVRKGEDLQINLQMMQKTTSILLINKPLYHYRKNPNGITQYVDKERMVRNCTDRLYLIKQKEKIYKKIYTNDRVNKEALKQECAHIVASQTIKLLSRRDTRYYDMLEIQNKLSDKGIIEYIKKINYKTIKHPTNNPLIKLILNNIIKNTVNGHYAKNIKYKFFCNLYYNVRTGRR